MDRPEGNAYPAAGTGPPGCHSGVVEIADLGTVTFGLNPPSSRGPREEKVNIASSFATTLP